MAKVALLVDDLRVSKYVKELADWLDSDPEMELAGIVVHPAPQSSVTGWRKLVFLARTQGIYVTLSRIAFALMARIERKLFLRAPVYRDHLASFDLSSHAAPKVQTSPIVSTSGFVYRFPAEDVARVRALGADVLVRCGNGILKGEILSASRCGIVSVHHGDNRVNRGGPAAFWEVFFRQAQTGFIVQRLTEELDGGEVLMRGSITTGLVYSLNQANLYARTQLPLMRTIRAVADGRETTEEPFIYFHQLYRTPLLGETIRYVLKTLGFGVGKLVRRLLRYYWRWGVGYIAGDWRGAVLWRARFIPNPPGHFLADPFAVEQDGRRLIFLEDFPYRTGKGVISAYEILPDGRPERLGVVVEEDFHLSFPYLFRWNGELWMVPESSAARQIRLYRCTSFPLQWTLERVLVDDVDAVDAMLFEREGRWWMMTTINETAVGTNDSDFFLFEAETPLGPWRRVGDGPVFIDAGRGRNGGLLRDGERLYRVAQRPSFGQYGRAFSIYEIDRLDGGYAETRKQDVEPLFLRGISGTHHLHHEAGLVTFDVVRNQRTG
ncbi:MAG TPA: hypothetical protein VGB08_03780 [Allosphingosinicella sp.]